MRAGRASRTAEINALFRALESSRPPERRLIEDRFAQSFLTGPLSRVARLTAVPALREFVIRFIDWRWPGTRTSVVARTRLIDDAIAASLGEGIEQFVVLGAGLDSRAVRLPGLRDVAVFEVDHPDTQEAKRRALARSVPDALERVRFVACDFERDDLASVVAAAGFWTPARAFVLWEGVSNYLTAEAVDATLGWVSRTAPRSRLLFTYVHADVLTHPEQFPGGERLFAALDRLGERFTFGLVPEELPAFFAARGLELESDVGAAEYRRRYYGEAADRMRGHEFYRVALARVAAPEA